MFLLLNVFTLTCHLNFRYNENEILSKVEELRRFLSEKEGITSKDKKEGRSKYVTFGLSSTKLRVNTFLYYSFQGCLDTELMYTVGC